MVIWESPQVNTFKLYEPREHGYKLWENKEDENPSEEWIGFL